MYKKEIQELKTKQDIEKRKEHLIEIVRDLIFVQKKIRKDIYGLLGITKGGFSDLLKGTLYISEKKVDECLIILLEEGYIKKG